MFSANDYGPGPGRRAQKLLGRDLGDRSFWALGQGPYPSRLHIWQPTIRLASYVNKGKQNGGKYINFLFVSVSIWREFVWLEQGSDKR